MSNSQFRSGEICMPVNPTPVAGPRAAASAAAPSRRWAARTPGTLRLRLATGAAVLRVVWSAGLLPERAGVAVGASPRQVWSLAGAGRVEARAGAASALAVGPRG